MAESGDPPTTNVDNQGGIEAGDQPIDDLERLSALFRPSWELDDAPFAAGPKLSAADVAALQPGAATALGLTPATAHGLSPATLHAFPAPASETSLTPSGPAPARDSFRPGPQRTPLPPRLRSGARSTGSHGMAASRARVRAEPSKPTLVDVTDAAPWKPSRRPLWIGIGAAVAVVVGVAWAATSGHNEAGSGSSDPAATRSVVSQPSAASVPAAVAPPVVVGSAPPAPSASGPSPSAPAGSAIASPSAPAPAEAASASPTAAASPPASTPAPVAAPPAPVAHAPTPAPPPAPAASTPVSSLSRPPAPMNPLPPRRSILTPPPPAPAPAAKPQKPGGTIVRDLPF